MALAVDCCSAFFPPMGRSFRFLLAVVFAGIVHDSRCASGWLLRPVDFAVREVMGTCQVTQPDGKKTAALAGLKIGAGTSLSTARRSRLELEFPNGMLLRMGAETQLKIDDFLQSPIPVSAQKREAGAEPSTSKTELALRGGEVSVELKALATDRGSSFSIETDAGVLRAKAGSFGIRIERSEKGFALLTIRTNSGTVEFEPMGGKVSAIPEKSERSFAVEPNLGVGGYRVREFTGGR